MKDFRFVKLKEQPVLYDDLTLWEHLELAASAYEMDRQYFINRSEELLNLFQLSEPGDDFISVWRDTDGSSFVFR
jgi:ABC-type multidrug transport system ATPase subunit